MTNEKFDYLIVPCPGDPTFHEDKIIFSDLEDDKINPGTKLYLGAEDRMRAAVINAQKAKTVVLIGGSESKVTSMYIYFMKEMECLKNQNRPELICLVSRPDSTGNLSAFKKYLNEKSPDNVAIISNEYHLPRLKLVWKTLFPEKELIELEAEKTLEDKGIRPKNKLYETALRLRNDREKEGQDKWKNTCYPNQDKIEVWNKEFWKCEELDLKFVVKEH